jgi:hypothetical protein
MLGMGDLKTLVKKAFDRGFIDSHILDFDHFEQDLKRGMECPGEPWPSDNHDYTLFGDTIEELSTWYCFTEQFSEDRELTLSTATGRWIRSSPRQCRKLQRKAPGDHNPPAECR